MSRTLLTGAGFTHNWGGWLAKEFEGDLLQRLSNDSDVHSVLQDADGFENALEVLEREVEAGGTDARGRYGRLKAAIVASFREINMALEKRGHINFCNDRAFSVNRFLARFDAIYTLNQDLLLELHYDPSLEESRQPRWSGRHFPGIEPYPNQAPFEVPRADRRRRVTGPPLKLDDQCQPIFKLHGSVDWFDSNGDFLIIGGGKESMIKARPILVEYRTDFERRLRDPGARLMIIGYGFRDEHINRVLADACAHNPSLSAFYVDPHGRRAVSGSGGRQSVLPQYVPPWGYMKCVGESTRALSSIFDGDALELRKLERFFT